MKILYSPNEFTQQRQRQKPAWVYPVRLAMEAQYYREKGFAVDWNNPRGTYDKVVTEREGIPFLNLPPPDRIFTRAFDNKYQKYGNYKHHPATHMQVADGCWHGQCTFCVERGRGYVTRPIYKVIDEIDVCNFIGFKEIFDDSGTFPVGEWLNDFCVRMIRKDYKMVLGCNMRITSEVDFRLMKYAGFRMLLFGIESANQKTLDKISKGVNCENIVPTLKKASEAGLEPHIAVMLGYPWETKEEEYKTVEMVAYLLRKGYARTAQASVYDVPGRAKRSFYSPASVYRCALYPEFWVRQFINLRSLDDIKYLLKGIRKGIIHD